MALRHFTVWAILVSSLGSTAVAAPRDQAYKLFNRVNGVPPTPAKLAELATLIEDGDLEGAAMAAINDSNAMFYNITLKNIVARWTNTDKTPRVPLNDYVATVIGMIRDDVPFDQVLSGDIVYTGNTAGLPAYSLANNAHYEAIDTAGSDLKAVLVQGQQSALTAIPADATAGVMTTRGFADAYYKAGTNRRAVAFTLDTFLCREMESLADTTRSDFRVRRDIPRAPGGDSALYKNRCAGCHTGMDAIGGAFAYYDWDDTTSSMIYTPGTVRAKVNRNAHEFPDGFETVDDSWLNNWLEGQNSSLGWNGAASGNGAKELGEMLTASDAFASCMAKRAVQAMCLRYPVGKDLDAVDDIAAEFKKSDYNLKNAFAKAAAYCVE
jgi:hypothetical protein